MLSVRVYAQQAEARVSHFHAGGGRQEVDIIVERADGRVIALEVVDVAGGLRAYRDLRRKTGIHGGT